MGGGVGCNQLSDGGDSAHLARPKLSMDSGDAAIIFTSSAVKFDSNNCHWDRGGSYRRPSETISALSSFGTRVHAQSHLHSSRLSSLSLSAAPPRRYLEEKLGGQADALGLGEFAVFRLGIEFGKECCVLLRHGREPAADRAGMTRIRAAAAGCALPPFLDPTFPPPPIILPGSLGMQVSLWASVQISLKTRLVQIEYSI